MPNHLPPWPLLTALGLVFATVTLLFLVGSRATTRGFQAYRARFADRLGSELRKSFIRADTDVLLLGSIGAAVVLGGAGAWFFNVPGALAGLIGGLVAPWVVVRRLHRRRVERFIYQLPDGLQSLAAALRSGANLARELEQVANRQPPPLSQEFSLVLAEYRVGRDLDEALQDLYRRIPRQEVALLTTAISVSRRIGGNLAQTLESLSATLYEKAQIEEKIQSLTAMGRAQGWVVGLLPVVIGYVLYLQQPNEMRLLFEAWYGWAVLAILATMMTLAVVMIRKIVNIDV
jgi:tight adherence protein B